MEIYGIFHCIRYQNFTCNLDGIEKSVPQSTTDFGQVRCRQNFRKK